MSLIKTPIRRLGKKQAILDILFSHFPPHNYFVEPFCGSGVVALNNPFKPVTSICNDLEDNIFNTYSVLACPSQTKELLEYLENIPHSETLFLRIAKNKLPPNNLVQKVGQFLILSSYSFLGKIGTFKYSFGVNNKKNLLENIQFLNKSLSKHQITWTCKDYKKFINSVGIKEIESSKIFCYCDPPYLGTANNYKVAKWTQEDFISLIELNISKGWNFAISEFDTDLVKECASQYKLNLVYLAERKNLKNTRTEVLLTNYKNNAGLFT
jgi:DNA adenine methylase